MIAKYCSYPQNGFTALHLAAQEGKVDVVKLLTEAKADVNIQTEVYAYYMIKSMNYNSLGCQQPHITQA